MIRFSNEEGFIKPRGIHMFEEYKNIKLPRVAIGVFSRYLYQDVVEKFPSYAVGELACANYRQKVYIIKYKDIELTFFMAAIGGTRITVDMEDLKVSGVDTFIIFGNCGVLDKNIADCSIIVPVKGYRDEGASYHYIDAPEVIPMNDKYKDLFIEILKEKGFNYTIGNTWTTDAPYRETKEKIDYYKKNGCVCVEMEGTAIAAVCDFLKTDYFTFYYAGDNLDSILWEQRSLDGSANLETKKEVPYLALELAYRITNL